MMKKKKKKHTFVLSNLCSQVYKNEKSYSCTSELLALKFLNTSGYFRFLCECVYCTQGTLL